MELKALAGVIILALYFLNSHTVLLSAATPDLSISSGNNSLLNRKLLEDVEIQDYDDPGANQLHDPRSLSPEPEPEQSFSNKQNDGGNVDKQVQVEVDGGGCGNF